MFKKLFVPSEDSDLTSMALLVARLWFSLAMLFNHGLDKFGHFKEIVGTFPDPLGLGQEASLVLVILAEVLGSLLLAVGLFTRIAAAVLVIDMFVAFLMVHKAGMSGGELAFLYLAGYVSLVIAGGGLFSLDTIAFSNVKRSSFQQRAN
jgi:putative oxidoreductase